MARTLLPVPERRAQVLAAASRVFSRNGFGGTRMADIAAAAEVAHGLVYRYFPSKEALFLALVDDSFARLSQAIAALQALPLDAGGKLAFALREILGRIETDEDFARRLTLVAQAGSAFDAPAETRAAWAAAQQAPYHAIGAIIAEGQAEGSVAEGPADDMALLFWTIVKGLAQRKQTLGPAFRAPDPDLVFRLFRPQQDRAR